jgi:hypothetical protein
MEWVGSVLEAEARLVEMVVEMVVVVVMVTEMVMEMEAMITAERAGTKAVQRVSW